MNAAMVNRALRAVELGEGGVTEAEVLRQALAELEVQRVALSGGGALAREAAVQYQVMAAVTARGYREGWSDAQFMARQACKVVAELGELAARFVFPLGSWTFLRWVEQAAREARGAFDMTDVPEEAWEATVRGDLAAALAGVLIPLLCLAEAAGVDALEAARVQALADVGSGRR
jgi:hypothetical protein